jgi:hypothetical protein
MASRQFTYRQNLLVKKYFTPRSIKRNAFAKSVERMIKREGFIEPKHYVMPRLRKR